MKKQNYLLVWLFICLSFFACKSDSQKKETPGTTYENPYSGEKMVRKDTSLAQRIDEENIIDRIYQWNDAHNRLDINPLYEIYDNWVFFYRKEVDIKEVLREKQSFFKKYPDFHQEIGGNIRVIPSGDGNRSQICYFTKIVTAGGKTQEYPAYLEFYRSSEKGYKIITEGDSVTDAIIQKRKHLISDKIKVKNGNIFLTLPNQAPKQITNLGQDTSAVLSSDAKKIVFLRQEKNEGDFLLMIYDIEKQQDTTVWQDFWLSIAYFDSAYNRVFVNGHGPMGCCMAVGVLNVNLNNNETKPICTGHFGTAFTKGENKGKYSFVQCGYKLDVGGCWEQTWLFDEQLKAVKALDKKHDMEW